MHKPQVSKNAVIILLLLILQDVVYESHDGLADKVDLMKYHSVNCLCVSHFRGKLLRCAHLDMLIT